MRARVGGPVYLGGHSYGGRQATMLAAENPGLVEGLLLLSYPLHLRRSRRNCEPPTSPICELRNVRPRTRDDFGSIEEMRAALELIPAATTLVPIEGAGHDLNRGKFDVERLVVRQFPT